MEDAFGTFLDNRVYNQLLPFPKSTSILVLTDGRWGKALERGGGAEDPIRRLVKGVKELLLSRNQVMIQFICFDNDQDAQRIYDLY
jgi:hypothetical protein